MAKKTKKSTVKKAAKKAISNIVAYYKSLGYKPAQIQDALYCNSL